MGASTSAVSSGAEPRASALFFLLPPPGPPHCIPHCIHSNIDGELTKYFTPATYTLNRSPRYDLSHTDVEDWVGRLLPSRLVRTPSDLLSKNDHHWVFCRNRVLRIVLKFVLLLTHTLSLCNVQFGVIVLTTANGILDHEEARRKKVGGKVLGEYF